MKGPNRFAKELGYSLTRLERLRERRFVFYRESEIPKTHDDGSQQLDENGVPIMRRITSCAQPLRGVHSAIKRVYLDKVTFGDHVHGSVKGRDILSNARQHLGLNHHFLTDISDFFPSISRQRVFFAFYDRFRLCPDAANLAADLTCLNGCLPQGTVTSPALANIVFQQIDHDILHICKQFGIVYTRYVDDLVFSAGHDFRYCLQTIVDVIYRHGFRLSHGRKTYYKIGPVEITGVKTRNNTTRARAITYAKRDATDPDSASYRGLNSHIIYLNGMGKNQRRRCNE